MRTLIADRGTGEPISLGAALTSGKKVAPDVIDLLMDDHRTVVGWFDWYETADKATKQRLTEKICSALLAHMTAEEEIFYPAARDAIGDEGLIDHSIAEHEGAKRLIAQLRRSGGVDQAHDRTMSELKTEILKHIGEEETELFVKVRASPMDTYAVGSAVAVRRVDRLFELRTEIAATKTGSAPASQLKETAPMPVSQDEARDFFILGLKNAHAVVNQGKTMVQMQIARLESYPDLRAKMESHLEEKNAQLERLGKILDSLGESPSALKDTAMAGMQSMMGVAQAAAGDEILKNSFAAFGLANYEAAAYETLLLFGEAAGCFEALQPLQKSLSEERAMAAFLAEHLRPTGVRFLQLRSEGRQAKR